jgi:hypothetical protein
MLNGWKEIAKHLGRGVRSVQRWERELKLPVHRVQTEKGQTVYARRSELDEWLRNRDPSAEPAEDQPAPPANESAPSATSLVPPPVVPAPRIRHPWFIGIATLAGIVVLGVAAESVTHVGWFSPVASRRATRFSLSNRAFEAFDAGGQSICSFDFGREVSERLPLDAPSQPLVADFDGHGDETWLVPVRLGRTGSGPAESDALYGLTTGCTLRWVVTSHRTFACRAETFDAPWQIRSMAVFEDAGKTRVWVSWVHHTWWPSFVEEVDGRGGQTLRYTQAGWVTALTHWQTPAGAYLVAAGVSNEYELDSLSLVRDAGPATRFPSEDRQYTCDDQPAASPAKVFLLPKLDVTEARGVAYPTVLTMAAVGADLKATLDDNGGSAIAWLTPGLELREFSLADRYWSIHRELEAVGSLRHSAVTCPERTAAKDVRVWTSAGGWQSVAIKLALRGR